MTVSPNFFTDDLSYDYAQQKNSTWNMNVIKSESLTIFNPIQNLDPVGTTHTPSDRLNEFLQQSYDSGYFGSNTIKGLYENGDMFYGIFVPCYPMVVGLSKSNVTERDETFSEVLWYFDTVANDFILGKELQKDFTAVLANTITNR